MRLEDVGVKLPWVADPRTLLEELQGPSQRQVQKGLQMHSVAKVIEQCYGTGQLGSLTQIGISLR